MSELISKSSIDFHKRRLKDKDFKNQVYFLLHKSTIEWWIGAMNLNPMKAGHQAKLIIKDLIRLAVIEEKITIDKAVTLWKMIKSEDPDDKYMALTVLKSHYPNYFK